MTYTQRQQAQRAKALARQKDEQEARIMARESLISAMEVEARELYGEVNVVWRAGWFRIVHRRDGKERGAAHGEEAARKMLADMRCELDNVERGLTTA